MHIATITAYENKFGTWTGVLRNEITKEKLVERFETYEAARNFVKAKAWDLFGEVKYASIRRKNEYLANVWEV